MQKKVTSSKKNKKAPTKGASNRKDAIFDYDLEMKKESVSKKKKHSLKNRNKKSRTSLDIEETPNINKKKLEKIKKQKKKENKKRRKEIQKQEKYEEKQRMKNKKRLSPQQMKKRKRKLQVIEILFLIALIITAITLFLLSPVFKITKIEVKGNEKISSDEITSLSMIEKETNLFKINKKEITNNIKQNSYVDTIKINRKIPNTVEIVVEERKVDYILEVESFFAYIDKQGYILEVNSENIENKIKILGFKTAEENIKVGSRLEDEDIQAINVASKIIDSSENYSLKQYITSVNISDESDYVLFLESENKLVHIGDTSNLEIKMLYLQSILEKAKESRGTLYLNVDFRNKYPYASWL